MKSISIKMGVFFLIAILLAEATNAQRRSTRRTPSVNQPPVTTNNNTTVVDPYAHLPLIIDSSVMIDTVPKSIRPPSTFDMPTGNRIPLKYEHIRRDDALYVQKVWRELDLKEKMNQSFRYEAINDNGSQVFVSMLLKMVKAGEVMAFDDDRFSTILSVAQVSVRAEGKIDTVIKYHITTMEPEARVVVRVPFDHKSVSKIRIMEEWIFDKESSRIHVRIIGIAPLKTIYFNGKERGVTPLFWVYYPDLRPMLANAEVYNPKNMGQAGIMTWDELFQTRMFSSYIVKSTLNNPSNLSIKQYIKDPGLALLEGENIRDKIFNYEQDLWSY